jgi:hypothetical protein
VRFLLVRQAPPVRWVRIFSATLHDLFYSLLFTIAGCERDALAALSIASEIYDYLPVT